MDPRSRLRLLYTASRREFAELAEACGLPKATLSTTLTGKSFPRAANLKRLLDALGVPAEAVESDLACLEWVYRLDGTAPPAFEALTDVEQQAVALVREAGPLGRYMVARMRAELELLHAQRDTKT